MESHPIAEVEPSLHRPAFVHSSANTAPRLTAKVASKSAVTQASCSTTTMNAWSAAYRPPGVTSRDANRCSRSSPDQGHRRRGKSFAICRGAGQLPEGAGSKPPAGIHQWRLHKLKSATDVIQTPPKNQAWIESPLYPPWRTFRRHLPRALLTRRLRQPANRLTRQPIRHL